MVPDNKNHRSSVSQETSRLKQIDLLADQLKALVHGNSVEIDSTSTSEEIALRSAKHQIQLRRRRDAVFSDKIPIKRMFGDPVWEMLLDLYMAHFSGHRVSVSSLCLASTSAATTALRYISLMEEHGLVAREADEFDARRIFVRLKADAIGFMTNILSS